MIFLEISKMETPLIILISVAIITINILFFWFLLKDKKLMSNELVILRSENQHLFSEKIQAETRYLGVLEQFHIAKNEMDKLQANCDQMLHYKYQAEKSVELAEQKMAEMERKVTDWEKNKEETKSVLFDLGNQLSTKLFEEHKKESEKAKEASAENIKKINDQFESIVKSVAAINNDIINSKKQVNIIWKALSSPGDAGQSAEIGLKNSFEAFGMEPNRDFIMQYSVSDESGARMRPDAIAFIDNNVLIVDSKSSKFFLEMAEAKGTDREAIAVEQLKKSMNERLKSLSTKEYHEWVKKSVTQEYNKTGRVGEIRHIFTVMYLPNEGAVEKLYRADAEFARKAIEKNIIIAGPTTLKGLIFMLNFQLAEERREKNQEVIMDEVKALINNIGKLYEYAEKMGKAIKSSAENYSNFAASFNRNLMGRVRRISQLGLDGNKKTISYKLPNYQIISANAELIEEEFMEPLKIEEAA